VTYQSSRTQQIQSFYTYAAGDRDLKLTVLGDPFALPPGVFAQIVEEEMPGNGGLQPPTHPRLSPDDRAKRGYQLALAFGGDLDETGAAACAGQGGGTGQASGGVIVVAAFCVNGRVLSEATGSVVADDPHAPAFRQLLAQLATSVFRPDENPAAHGDGGHGGGFR
jgi:hypothetical protein